MHPQNAPELHLKPQGTPKAPVPPAALGKLGKAGQKLRGAGKYAGPALNAGLTGYGLYEDLKSGQGKGEAISGAIGNFAAGQIYSGGPVDTAINLTNAGLQLAGAPKEVTDTTSVVADATPSSFVTSMAKQAGRGIYNIASGDTKALDKQVQEMQEGKAGAPLQGYAMLTELAADAASGKDLDQTIMRLGSKGDNTVLKKAGDYLGDQTYQFINKDLPEASEFAKKDLKNLKESAKDKMSRAWHWIKD